MTSAAAAVGDGLWWAEKVFELLCFAAMFGLGFFWGKVVQLRRFSKWAAQNPHEVYRLAEELREIELRQAHPD